MKKKTSLIVIALVLATILASIPVSAATRVGQVSSTIFGLEYEPAEGDMNLAYSAGLVSNGDKIGLAAGATMYLGDFERHTNRPYAGARLGLLGSGGGITYGATVGYSVSMGFLQLLPNLNYTDGQYGVGLGATFQF